MMTRTVFILLISSLCTLSYCTPRTEPAQTEVLTPVDSISKDSAVIMETLVAERRSERSGQKQTLVDSFMCRNHGISFQFSS